MYKASESPHNETTFIPTGFPVIDSIVGGGIPRKKIFECSGQWSVGKSTFALQVVAHAQKQGIACAWIDSEYSFSERYSKDLGIDMNKLDLSQQPYAELLLDDAEEWATKHKNGLIVIDSIGGLLPKEESEKTSESRSIGLQARIVSSFCRRIVPILATKNHALIILNHNFVDIQTGRLKTSGGEKLSYARSVWLTLKRSYCKPAKRTKDGKKTILFLEAEIRKNKLFPSEGMKCELEMIPGQGFISAPMTLFENPPKRRGRPKSI